MAIITEPMATTRARPLAAPATAPVTGVTPAHWPTHWGISWGAVLAGVVLAITIHIMLGLLGAGIGFSTLDVAQGTTPSASALSAGAGIWWLVSGIISLLAGSYFATWLAGVTVELDGMLNGLVVWGVTALLTVYLLTSAVGGLIGGGMSAISSIASAAGSGLKSAAAPIADASGISPDMLQQQAQAYMQPLNQNPATMTPQDAQKALALNMAAYAKGDQNAPQAKANIIAISAVQLHISPADAEQRFDAAQAQFEQTKAQAEQKARAAADAAAKAASQTSFLAFFDLLFGAIAAAIGGVTATRRRLLHRI